MTISNEQPGATQGFTVIELVTTITIVGILSAIALPRFFDNQAFTDRGHADELASTLRYAQRIAIASRCPVRVRVNAANYDSLQRNGCGAGAWGTPVRRADGTNSSGQTPAGVAIVPAATSLIFDANGNVSAGAAITVGGTFTITVDAANGRVTVQP